MAKRVLYQRCRHKDISLLVGGRKLWGSVNTLVYPSRVPQNVPGRGRALHDLSSVGDSTEDYRRYSERAPGAQGQHVSTADLPSRAEAEEVLSLPRRRPSPTVQSFPVQPPALPSTAPEIRGYRPSHHRLSLPVLALTFLQSPPLLRLARLDSTRDAPPPVRPGLDR